MVKQIIKRDGTKEKFDPQKIEIAVLKAFKEVDGTETKYAKDKAHNIATYIYKVAKDDELTVEEIQDMVEKGLMSLKRKEIARAYITYRNERTREREKKSNIIKTLKTKISAKDIQNSNANMDEASFGGRLGSASDEIMKEYALNYCMSEMSRNNHLNNEIYIHDLSHYALGSHNCLSIPFDKLLKNGFKTRNTDIRPANSINTAFQLVAVIFQIQSLCQFGRLNSAC